MTVAIITARGGSKGLKRKNVLEFNGKPLIAWTIEAALASNSIDECYVTTEDAEIAEVALKFGAKVINRPIHLAGDLTSSDEVLSHALNAIEIDSVDDEVVVLLQPTSPLRNAIDIEIAHSIFKEKNAECVISVFEPKHSAAKAYKLEQSGEITGLYNKDAPYTPRQKLPQTLQPNGAIYIFYKNEFTKTNKIPRNKIHPYIMTEELSIDIDDIDDFKRAESVMRNRK